MKFGSVGSLGLSIVPVPTANPPPGKYLKNQNSHSLEYTGSCTVIVRVAFTVAFGIIGNYFCFYVKHKIDISTDSCIALTVDPIYIYIYG